jgi:hypothetical protein
MPGLANGRLFIVPENYWKISMGSSANTRQNSPYNPLFPENSRFNQNKSVQFRGRSMGRKNRCSSACFPEYLPTGYRYGPKIDP